MTLQKLPHPKLRALIGLLALACTVTVALLARPSGAPAEARPNVVVIQTDDQTLADLYAVYTNPATGVASLVMPNTLGLIAAQGITFNRYYVSNPLCCPSRTTMLTGRYSHNTGVLTNFFPSGGFYKFDLQNNLAVWLHNAGYETSHVGKFLNQYGDNDPTQVPPGWDDWHTVIGDARLFYGYTTNDNGVVSDPHGSFDETTKSYPEKDATSCPDNPPPLQQCNYLTDLITNDTLNAINKFGSNPFYVQVDYTTSHGDIALPGGPEPAPKYAGSMPGAKAPRDPSFNERDMSDKPAFVRRNPRLGFGKIDYIDRRYENRLEALRSVDDGVEQDRQHAGRRWRTSEHLHRLHLRQRVLPGPASLRLCQVPRLRALHPPAAVDPRPRNPPRHPKRPAGGQHRPRADHPQVDRRHSDGVDGRLLVGSLLQGPGEAQQGAGAARGLHGQG